MMKKYIFLLILIFFPVSSSAASISLSPLSGSYKAGESFEVKIMVDPGVSNADTVRAIFSYPSGLLEIKDFSNSQQFSYQTGSNGFDNNTGVFSWGAGTPGGISSPTVFGTILFFTKKDGEAKIDLNSSSLVLSAGQNVFDGQAASSSFSLLPQNLEPVSKPKLPVKQPVVSQNKIQPSSQAEALSSEKNTTDEVVNNLAVFPETESLKIEENLISKTPPQSFLASMLGVVSLGSAVRLGSLALVAIIIFTMAVILRKIFSVNKKSKT